MFISFKKNYVYDTSEILFDKIELSWLRWRLLPLLHFFLKKNSIYYVYQVFLVPPKMIHLRSILIRSKSANKFRDSLTQNRHFWSY